MGGKLPPPKHPASPQKRKRKRKRGKGERGTWCGKGSVYIFVSYCKG
ncbi:MAG: hypothetical protein MJE68_15345 [Proteobacteria bacterium]|nr:hypothetical protein [Pseudomonadota bacterium]